MKIQKFDSINVVSFIDIMLVLLVIVLTTATFVANGMIPVNLSQSKSAAKNQNLMITIKSNGNIFFGKESISRDKIEAKLSSFKKNITININCDKNAKFDNFVYIIDILKQKGYENLGIITKYE